MTKKKNYYNGVGHDFHFCLFILLYFLIKGFRPAVAALLYTSPFDIKNQIVLQRLRNHQIGQTYRRESGIRWALFIENYQKVTHIQKRGSSDGMFVVFVHISSSTLMCGTLYYLWLVSLPFSKKCLLLRKCQPRGQKYRVLSLSTCCLCVRHVTAICRKTGQKRSYIMNVFGLVSVSVGQSRHIN